MLLESGDLIPVKRAAVDIPWTRRKSMVLNFLHRGPVEFTVMQVTKTYLGPGANLVLNCYGKLLCGKSNLGLE